MADKIAGSDLDLKECPKAQFRFSDIYGKSERIQEAIRIGKIASGNRSNVLLVGESGTGKTVFAQAIHNDSIRKDGPFIFVNCGFPKEILIENELFKQAEGGTIFFDEIGDLTPGAQIWLLQALKNEEIVRIGREGTEENDARIIAATNRNIDQLVRENFFRRDLYYRLNVFSMKIPSLAERKEDILLLSSHFAKKYSAVQRKSVKYFSDDVAKLFLRYDWPGNIRELENVIGRAVSVARTDVILPEDLPFDLQGGEKPRALEPKIENGYGPLNKVQQLEREAIKDALEDHRGNISKTAEFLGINRRTLHRRIENYGIDVKQYKK